MNVKIGEHKLHNCVCGCVGPARANQTALHILYFYSYAFTWLLRSLSEARASSLETSIAALLLAEMSQQIAFQIAQMTSSRSH